MSLRSTLTRRLARVVAAVVPFVTIAVATGVAEAAPCHAAMCSDRRLKHDIRPI